MRSIDLEEYTRDGKIRNLSGKDRGLDARRQYKLDEIDQGEESVIVRIPKYIYAISTSFFCGMFSRSYERLGSKEDFLVRYRFDATELQWKQIDQGIERCASDFRPLVSSNQSKKRKYRWK